MKKLNSLVNEKFNDLIKNAESLTQTFICFVKKHKKLIAVIVGLYLFFNWLFGEDQNEDKDY